MFLDKLRIIADGDFIPYEWRYAVLTIVFSKEYVYENESRLLQIGGIFFFGATVLFIAFLVGVLWSLMKI